MIKIVDKELCCGCEACAQKCPLHCIEMKEDGQGFLYPEVNVKNCISCGQCEKVCPVLNNNYSQEPPTTVYAAKIKDDKIRYASSSGGVFTSLATYVIKQGGVVFGASYDNNWRVVHIYTEQFEGISKFRGSKYVQSSLGSSFVTVRNFLKEGRLVLFTGTPCQISALHQYLGQKFSNLITMDFVCHGVPSPGVFKWYLQETLNKVVYNKPTVIRNDYTIKNIPSNKVSIPNGWEIKDIRFRDKRKGWKKFCLSIDLIHFSKNGECESLNYSKDLQTDPFLVGFIRNCYLRPSCYHCKFKSFTSGSDFTVADFWGQEVTFPEFDSNSGVSCLIPNTLVSKSILNRLENIVLAERPFNDFYRFNPSIIKNSIDEKNYRIFWSFVGHFTFNHTISLAVLVIKGNSLIRRIRKILKL